MLLSISRILRGIRDAARAGRLDLAGDLAAEAIADGSAMTDAYVALQAPMVPLTWETYGPLRSSDIESNVLPLRFPKPVQLVAVLPFVVPARPDLPAPPLATATLNDVLVSVNIDREKQLTAQQQPGTNTGGQSAYVTAAALSLGLPRLLAQEIDSPTPQLDFQFKWKQGTGIFVDSIVSVAVFARYLDRR